MLKSAVEGELTREWREADQATLEPASELLTRILQKRREQWEAEQHAKGRKNAVYKEPAPPNVSSLPELPEGWVWTTVDALSSSIRTGTPAVPTDDMTDLPILRSSSLRPGLINFNDVRYLDPEFHNYSENSLEDSDVLGCVDIWFTKCDRVKCLTSNSPIGNGSRFSSSSAPAQTFTSVNH